MAHYPLRFPKTLRSSSKHRTEATSDGAYRELLTHDAIPIPIAHEAVRRMRTQHRRDPVPARLRARNRAVSIVVVTRERIVTGDPAGIARRP